MTDQEWQEGIERALNAAWDLAEHDAKQDAGRDAVRGLVVELVFALPLRIALCHTGKDQSGHFRVGPARDEEA